MENAAYLLGPALVLYAADTEDRGLAERYDLQISAWRRLRDEELLQRARLLQSDAAAIVNGAIVNGAIVNGVIVNGVIVNGVIVNGVIVNGVIVAGAIVAGAIVAGANAATAAQFGINAAGVTTLESEADDYNAYVTALQDAVADRSALTASLASDSRAVAVKFDEIASLILQYSSTVAGAAFIAKY